VSHIAGDQAVVAQRQASLQIRQVQRELHTAQQKAGLTEGGVAAEAQVRVRV